MFKYSVDKYFSHYWDSFKLFGTFTQTVVFGTYMLVLICVCTVYLYCHSIKLMAQVAFIQCMDRICKQILYIHVSIGIN